MLVFSLRWWLGAFVCFVIIWPGSHCSHVFRSFPFPLYSFSPTHSLSIKIHYLGKSTFVTRSKTATAGVCVCALLRFVKQIDPHRCQHFQAKTRMKNTTQRWRQWWWVKLSLLLSFFLPRFFWQDTQCTVCKTTSPSSFAIYIFYVSFSQL